MVDRIIVNCDMGEKIGNDAELMPYIDACSIACGGHVGDKYSIAETIQLAKEYHVKIGAHPSYPDPDNFGRKSMDINDESVLSSLRKQLDLFFDQTEKAEADVFHIKPHGALYNDVYTNPEMMEAFGDILSDYLFKYLFVASGFEGRTEIPFLREAFADRQYTIDLKLIPRSDEHAMINDINHFEKQNAQTIKEKTMKCIDGIKRPIYYDTLCLHGDHPLAIEYAQSLQSLLG